jgi:hypothetical protein
MNKMNKILLIFIFYICVININAQVVIDVPLSILDTTDIIATKQYVQDQGGGGGGLPSLLPTQDVAIEADSTALEIDSLSHFRFTDQNGNYFFSGEIDGSNGVILGKINPGEFFGNAFVVTTEVIGISAESADLFFASAGGLTIDVEDGVVIGELLYPFEAANDTSALLFNADGTGFLLDLPEYLAANAGGSSADGNGIISALPAGDVNITADSTALIIDNLSYTRLLLKNKTSLDVTPTAEANSGLYLNYTDNSEGNFKSMGVSEDGILLFSSDDIQLSGNRTLFLGGDIVLNSISSFEVDELSYPFTSPVQDSSALLFNADGTGFLLDLPEYLAANAGGSSADGNGLISALPNGTVKIEASDSLVIDSISLFILSTQGNGYPQIKFGAIPNDPFPGVSTGFSFMLEEEAGLFAEDGSIGIAIDNSFFVVEGEGIFLESTEIYIGENVYPQSNPTNDTSALVFNADGTGFLLDLPEYISSMSSSPSSPAYGSIIESSINTTFTTTGKGLFTSSASEEDNSLGFAAAAIDTSGIFVSKNATANVYFSFTIESDTFPTTLQIEVVDNFSIVAATFKQHISSTDAQLISGSYRIPVTTSRSYALRIKSLDLDITPTITDAFYEIVERP